jgi:hypothetical protein
MPHSELKTCAAEPTNGSMYCGVSGNAIERALLQETLHVGGNRACKRLDGGRTRPRYMRCQQQIVRLTGDETMLLVRWFKL